MIRYIGLLLMLVHGVLSGSDIRSCPPQTAVGVCTRSADDILTFDFKLDVLNSAKGAVAVYPPGADDTCSIPYNEGTRVYQFSVDVDLGRRAPVPGQSGCGVTFARAGPVVNYIWKVIYYELENRTDANGGCNRLFMAECNDSNTVDLQVTAAVTVSELDLVEDVIPVTPVVDYYVLAETFPGSGIFARIGPNNEVSVQTLLKLRLVYSYGLYSDLKFGQIGGLGTRVTTSQQSQISETFLDNNGCPVGFLSPLTGFIYVDIGLQGVYAVETNHFPAFRFDQGSSSVTQTVIFRTNIVFCYGQGSNTVCSNPCGNSPARKRRQESEEEPEYATASVRIVNRRPESSGISSNNDTLVYAAVGGCIGICVILIAMLACMLFVIRRRRRQREADEKKMPPQVFTNHVKIPY